MNIAVELARGTLDALPLNMAVLNSEGEIIASNRAWQEFGQSNGIDGAADTVGENYLAVTRRSGNSASARQAGRELERVLDGDRETFSFEYPCHSPDRKRWFLMHASRFTVDGEPYLVVAHEDITTRKMAELEVERRNEDLETFAHLLSHDLRNPLTVAAGRAELLAEETDSEHVDQILSALDRMDRLIEDVLGLMETKTQSLDREDIELQTLAERSWEHVETADATLRVTGHSVLNGDPGLLAHLFENLYRNAVEHAGRAVTVTVGTLDDGFYVEDDGPGVPPDECESIFEMGFTTSGSTGFGLGIVQHIVEIHGWEIDVMTGESGGARFEVRVRPTFPERGRAPVTPGC